MQVHHIVLCKVQPDKLDQFSVCMRDLACLQQKLQFADMQAGPNTSPEGLNRDYTHGFSMTFPNPIARDTYLNDPDHQAIGARLVSLCQGGIEGILVLDI